MRSPAIFLILAGLLVGCASMDRFRNEMDGYLGWDADRLREQFGYNYIERDLGDGRRALTWVWRERGVRSGYLSPDVIHSYRTAEGATQVLVSPGTYFPPDYFEYACEFSFILNPEGRAVSWRAQGDGCAAYPGPERVLYHEGGPQDGTAPAQTE